MSVSFAFIRFFSYQYSHLVATPPLSCSLFHLLPHFSSTLSVSISIYRSPVSLVIFFSALLTTASWSLVTFWKPPPSPHGSRAPRPAPLDTLSSPSSASVRPPTSLSVRLRLPLCCRHHYRHRFSVSLRYLNRLSRDAAIVDNAGEWERVLQEESGRFRISYPDTRTNGGAAALLCRRTFGSVGACACLPLIELSHFALLVHRFFRLSSFFYSITLVSLSLSLSLSVFLVLSLLFVRCMVPVREFLPNSVKCDFFGWSKKSPCDYTVYRLTLWPSFIDQRFSVATDAARYTRYICTYTQCVQHILETTEKP